MPSFTVDQVKELSTKDRTIVTYDQRVYDVTKFLESHPGGSKIISEHAGEDIQDLMQKPSPHTHSKYAYSLLEKYCIGDLESDHKQAGDKGTRNAVKTHDQSNLKGYKEDELIDWSKPILWQVGRLGKSYEEWVHAPVEGHLRLFHYDFVEYFSGTPWYMIPVFWVPVMAYCLYRSYTEFEAGNSKILQWCYGGATLSCASLPVVFILGVLLWTLMEYSIHRWLFHSKPPTDSYFLITAHFLIHGQHHKAPFDKERLVFPIVPAVIAAVAMWTFMYKFFPPAVAYALFAGFDLGYMSYDLTHYYLHHGTPAFEYFRTLKKYHIQHHFINQELGFGISSKLWDYPFGTLLPGSEGAHSPKEKLG